MSTLNIKVRCHAVDIGGRRRRDIGDGQGASGAGKGGPVFADRGKQKNNCD
tara:strand:- start:581 stop:733 length:153 start_codon:yes stop_codon:yes gene_type:complete